MGAHGAPPPNPTRLANLFPPLPPPPQGFLRFT